MPEHAFRLDRHREHPRLKLPAMYTLLRVRQPGETRYRWFGHIYDVSLSGMRFELDTPLEAGTQVEVRGMLPGRAHIQFRATGKVVRIHDNTAGPTRMALTFDSFHRKADRRRLQDYLTIESQPTHVQRKAA